MEYNFDNKIGKFYYNDYEFVGTLNKNNNNYEITVIDREFKSEDEYLLIRGNVNNKAISFVMINNPIYSSKSEHITETFLIHFLFIGKNINSLDELKFKNISLKINNISSIIHLSSFDFSYDEEKNQEHSPLIIKPTDGYYIKLNDDLKIEIKLNSYKESLKVLGNGESICYQEDISIILRYTNYKNINEITKDVIIIRNLFSFITGNSQINEMFIEDYEKHIPIILPIITDEKAKRSYSALKLDESNIEKILRIWFENYESHHSIYDLFFTAYPSFLNPATLFLTYARILESYHRKNYDGVYATKSKFDKISKKVKNCLKDSEIIKKIEDENEKEKLLMNIKTSISYSYEYTLKDRLLELFNDLTKYDFFNDILTKYSDNENKLNEFCNIIKDNRNYYTHYGKKNKNVLDGVELSELNECLKLIIIILFFKEFELSYKQINELIRKDRRFMFKHFYSWK